MLEYYALIYQHYRAPVLQQVLYVGAGPNPLAESIAQDSLQYRYHAIDIRDIDCRRLLASPTLEDNLLALLCGLDDEAKVVRTVLGKIAALDENTRRDALQWLEILCGLRPLKPVIQREIEKMPISLNLKENPFFQEAFAEGEQKGRVEGEYALLSKQLEKRFGPLPENIVERLKARAQVSSRHGVFCCSVPRLSTRCFRRMHRHAAEDLETEPTHRIWTSVIGPGAHRDQFPGGNRPDRSGNS